MKFTLASAVIAASVALIAPASAGVVTFGTGAASNHKVFTNWVEDGMTMSPVDLGGTHTPPHWDLYSTGPNATAADNNARIHRGDGGEEVNFALTGGGAFNLTSIDFDRVVLEAPSLDITFTSNLGSLVLNFASNSSTTSTYDFSTNAFFQGITYFTMGATLGDYGCGANGGDCSSLNFDNVTFTALQTAVPEPLTLSLFGAGLLGAVAIRRRRKIS